MASDWKKIATPDHPDFRLEHYPFFLMNLAAGHYNTALAAALSKIGVDQPVWRVLMILGERKSATVSEIAALAVMKVPTTTRVIQRMQKRQLVNSAVGSQDARYREVSLTRAGARELGRVKTVASQLFRHAMRGMSSKDIKLLNESLRRIHGNLEGGVLSVES